MKSHECTIDGDASFLKKEQRVFIVLSVFLSLPFMIPVWRGMSSGFQPGDQEALKDVFGSWLMLYGTGPMVSAILVTAWFRGKSGMADLFGRVVRLRVKPRWFFFALVLPLTWQWSALWLWGTLTSTEIAYPSVANYLSSWLFIAGISTCLLYTSPSPRDQRGSRMPSSA